MNQTFMKLRQELFFGVGVLCLVCSPLVGQTKMDALSRIPAMSNVFPGTNDERQSMLGAIYNNGFASPGKNSSLLDSLSNRISPKLTTGGTETNPDNSLVPDPPQAVGDVNQHGSDSAGKALMDLQNLKAKNSFSPQELHAFLTAHFDGSAAIWSSQAGSKDSGAPVDGVNHLSQVFIIDLARFQLALSRNDHKMATQICAKWLAISQVFPGQIEQITLEIAIRQGFSDFPSYMREIMKREKTFLAQ